MRQTKQSINTLVSLEKAKDYLKINKQSVEKLDKEHNSILEQAFNFKTKDTTYTKMKRDITNAVKASLSKIDEIDSIGLGANTKNSSDNNARASNINLKEASPKDTNINNIIASISKK